MPHAAWVATNGLNAWLIVLSGELSMTSVCDVPELEVLVGLLDEHAAAPVVARTAAAVTVTSFLGPSNLLIIFVSCRRNGRYPPWVSGVR
jgi:hypothetical protein